MFRLKLVPGLVIAASFVFPSATVVQDSAVVQGSPLLAPATSAAVGRDLSGSDAATAPPEPTHAELLPEVDLVTEEVEPGVLRVISDGARDLSAPIHPDKARQFQPMFLDVAAGRDGSVWLFWLGRFFRVGDAQSDVGYEVVEFTLPLGDMEVEPDGLLWTVVSGNLFLLNGDWPPVPKDGPGGPLTSLEIQADGTLVVAWVDKKSRGIVARLVGDTWERLGGRLPAGRLIAQVEVSNEALWYTTAREGPYRYSDEEQAWEDRGEGRATGVIAVGSDGTLWTRIGPRRLARLDETGWMEYGRAAGVPQLEADSITGQPFEVGPDGSVWVVARDGKRCDGIHNFDGVTWARYLRDLCVHAMDVAQDGTVWLQAGKRPTKRSRYLSDTYVILPTASPATETVSPMD